MTDWKASSALVDLVCPECREAYPADELQTFCHECQSPLLARYDLDQVRSTVDRDSFRGRPRGLWRWSELLPLRDPAHRVTLGEGDTPLLATPRLAALLGLEKLFVKEEGVNPTGTFKARGLAMAVSRGVELGVREFVIPTAGNAGGALAAYAARARLPAHVFMPADAPTVNVEEVRTAGADLRLVEGLIDLAGRMASAAAQEHGWFDVSTLKEPYRLEGKKTMGLELAEAFHWELPDVIFYPTGGGTGLIGMWKAFGELEHLGWIGRRRPRLVSVQADGCAPIVQAFDQGLERAVKWEDAATFASGLRVPVAFADRLILRSIHETNGTAVAVSDEAIRAAQRELSQEEGILASPEGAATVAGLRKLVESGWIRPEERVVLFNTGNGLKYLA